MSKTDPLPPADAVALAFRGTARLVGAVSDPLVMPNLRVEQRPDDPCIYVETDTLSATRFRLCPLDGSRWYLETPTQHGTICNAGETSGYHSADIVVDSGPGAVASNPPGCHDPESDPTVASAITFLGRRTVADPPGTIVTETDTCKSAGLLIERTCQGYDGPTTLPSELALEVWQCQCEAGACLPGTVNRCTEPERRHYDGQSVWVEAHPWGEKRFYSECADDRTVRYVYCNTNGSLHTDERPCGFDEHCADGMCGGFACTDDKPPGIDPSGHLPPGTLTFVNPTTQETIRLDDYCDGLASIFQRDCPIATTMDVAVVHAWHYGSRIFCATDESCDWFGNQTCTPDNRPPATPPSPLICVDEMDTADDPMIRGFLLMHNPTTGEEGMGHYDQCHAMIEDDFTRIASYVTQSTCDLATGDVAETQAACPDGTVCIYGSGMCQPGSCDFSCADDKPFDPFASGALFVRVVCGGTPFPMEHAYFDQCNGPTSLAEYFCLDGQPQVATATCPPTYYCTTENWAGECRQCTDTDAANLVGAPGMVIDVLKQQAWDLCTDTTHVKEVACSASGMLTWMASRPCPAGTTCAQGTCQ